MFIKGDIIAPLQHHLSSNRIIYVETDRDSAETVFNFLKDKNHDVYLRPDKNMIYRYVDMDSRVIFVKNLVSEAPLARSIRRAYAHVGKTVSGYIERYGLFLPARQ